MLYYFEFQSDCLTTVNAASDRRGLVILMVSRTTADNRDERVQEHAAQDGLRFCFLRADVGGHAPFDGMGLVKVRGVQNNGECLRAMRGANEPYHR